MLEVKPSAFKIEIVNGQVHLLCSDEVPETDIIDLLEFDETNLEYLYEHHAAIQSRWEQIAINMKNRYELFCEDFEKKWWAHNKRFSKLVLNGYGEKTPTQGDIKDMVITIYSTDTLDRERSKFGEIAYKIATDKKVGSTDTPEEFINNMFKYINLDPPWHYETLLYTVKDMEKNVLTVQNIAKRLESRAFHMKDLKDLLSAKQFNIGPVSVRDERSSIERASSYYNK